MTEEGPDRVPDENARAAYQAAVNAWTYEGNGYWIVFGHMVTANAVVVAAAALIWDRSRALGILVSIAGVVLCAAWWSITSRRNQIHDYRILAAREIEERYFSGVTTLLTRGAAHAEGKTVTLALKDGPECLRIGGVGRIKGDAVAVGVILLFAALHIGLGVFRGIGNGGPAQTMLLREMQRGVDLQSRLTAAESDRARLAADLKREQDLRQALERRLPPRAK
jgi:hypothetical protein